MTALDLPDDHLGGIVAMYSIIHIPPGHLPEVFAEFHRVLVPGGHLLLAFQAGDERRHVTEAFGRPVSVDAYACRRATSPRCSARQAWTCAPSWSASPTKTRKPTSAPTC